MLASTPLQSHFDYVCNFWYRDLPVYIKNKVQSAQNKIIRFVCNYHSRHHLVVKDFEKVGLLDVNLRVDYITLCHMFNVFHDCGPSYMLDNFDRPCNVRHTRCNSDFIIPQVKTQGKKTFKYNGSKLWNTLPSTIKNVNEKAAFKSNVKVLLFDKMKMKNDEETEFYYY